MFMMLLQSQHVKTLLILLMLELTGGILFLFYMAEIGDHLNGLTNSMNPLIFRLNANATKTILNSCQTHHEGNETGCKTYKIASGDIIFRHRILNGDIHKMCLEPDNWQTIQKNISYVHSAHLHPNSNDGVALIQIIGALRKREWLSVNGTKRISFKCRLWTWQYGVDEPTVSNAKVDQIVLQSGVRE
jgi:hypothetical protein